MRGPPRYYAVVLGKVGDEDSEEEKSGGVLVRFWRGSWEEGREGGRTLRI